MEYTFTLKYQLPVPDVRATAPGAVRPRIDIHDDLMRRLQSVGCDDALVGVGLTGCLGLEFTREGETPCEVLELAQASVSHAIPGARLLQVKQLLAAGFVEIPRS